MVRPLVILNESVQRLNLFYIPEALGQTMDDLEDLSAFISSSRSTNLHSAEQEALRIHQKINFKKYISDAISQNQKSVSFGLMDALRVGGSENYDPDDGWESEYIHSGSEIFAGEETWSQIWRYFVELVEGQGISCSLLRSAVCRTCSTVRYEEKLDSDGEVNCNPCGGYRKGNMWVTGLRLSWE
ncbi:hypothetical protein OAM96_00855 [Candidatus Poseidoniaceae archaeon]|nr:hypothetical protein [Candidatus Poseidoniaceae archaeon]